MAHQIKPEGGANLSPAAPSVLKAEGAANLSPAGPGPIMAEAMRRAGVLVSGVLSPDVTGFIPQVGTVDGHPYYVTDGVTTITRGEEDELIFNPPENGTIVAVYYLDPTGWGMRRFVDANPEGEWASPFNVATPDLGAWLPDAMGTTGNPEFTLYTAPDAPEALKAEGSGNLAPAAPSQITSEGGASLSPGAPSQIKPEFSV